MGPATLIINGGQQKHATHPTLIIINGAGTKTRYPPYAINGAGTKTRYPPYANYN